VSTISFDEQIEIDAAKHDGQRWALPRDTSSHVVEALAAKGLIETANGTWHLTRSGFALTTMAKGRSFDHHLPK
jgi:hypothetical protein